MSQTETLSLRPLFQRRSSPSVAERAPQRKSASAQYGNKRHSEVLCNSSVLRVEAEGAPWELSPEHALGQTDWYRGLEPRARRTLGLDVVIASMQQRIAFENAVDRGLLRLTLSRPSGNSTFRHAYDEVLEEAHPSRSVQELIERSDSKPGRLSWRERTGADLLAGIARVFPTLFMVCVLAGEEVVGVEARKALASAREIHTMRERRHRSFARAFLQEEVSKLGWLRRMVLRVVSPWVIRAMARRMLEPSAWVVERHGIPAEVLRTAYAESEGVQERRVRSVAGVVTIAEETGVKTPGMAWWWSRALRSGGSTARAGFGGRYPMPAQLENAPGRWAWPNGDGE